LKTTPFVLYEAFVTPRRLQLRSCMSLRRFGSGDMLSACLSRHHLPYHTDSDDVQPSVFGAGSSRDTMPTGMVMTSSEYIRKHKGAMISIPFLLRSRCMSQPCAEMPPLIHSPKPIRRHLSNGEHLTHITSQPDQLHAHSRTLLNAVTSRI